MVTPVRLNISLRSARDFLVKPSPIAPFNLGLVEPKWRRFWNRNPLFFFPFWERSGVPRSIVNPTSVSALSGTPAWVPTKEGPAPSPDSNGEGWQVAESSLWDTAELTLLAVAREHATEKSITEFILNRGTNTVGSWIISSDISLNELGCAVKVNGGTQNGASFTSYSPSEGNISSFALTYKDPLLRLFYNGVPVASNTDGGTLDGGTGDLIIGNHPTVTDREWGDAILLVGGFGEAFSAEEIREWHADYYGPLRMHDMRAK